MYYYIFSHFGQKVNLQANPWSYSLMEMDEQQTIFHKIRDGEIPADIVYDDDEVLIFRDIHPKAPTHLLIIPKRDEDVVASIADVSTKTAHVPGMLIAKAQKFAASHGIDGYKLTYHVGKGGGQEVFYLHLHLLSQQTIDN